MTPDTIAKAARSITDLQHSLGAASYEQMIKTARTPEFEAFLYLFLTRDPGGVQVAKVLFPEGCTLTAIDKVLADIETPAKRDSFLATLDEPTPEEVFQAAERFKKLPSMLKSLLADAATKIRPKGGPPKKLASPSDLDGIIARVAEGKKEGRTLDEVAADIAAEAETSIYTVKKRIRDELKKRRAQRNATPKAHPSAADETQAS